MCRASPWGFAPFQAFLASSPCAASAFSYHFSSSAPPWWHTAFSRFVPVVNSEVSVLASGSNCAVKPTRLRQAAYFLSLGLLEVDRHMLRSKPCPSCGQSHGHSPWKAFNSSIVRPIRCKACKAYFHQVGIRAWFVSSLIPIELFVLLPWALVFLALPEVAMGIPAWLVVCFGIALQAFLTTLYIDRRYPLASGPKHG